MASFTQRRSDVEVVVVFYNKLTGEEAHIVFKGHDDYNLFKRANEKNGWVIKRGPDGRLMGWPRSDTREKSRDGFRTHAAYIRA